MNRFNTHALHQAILLALGATPLLVSANASSTPINKATITQNKATNASQTSPSVNAPLNVTANVGDVPFTLNLLLGATDPTNSVLSVSEMTFAVNNRATGNNGTDLPDGLKINNATLTINPKHPALYTNVGGGIAWVIEMSYTIRNAQGAAVKQTATIALSQTLPKGGLQQAYNIGVYTGLPIELNNLNTPFKAFTDYAAQNQGWTHSAQFLTLTVGSEQDIASGKTYDVVLTMTGRGNLGSSGAVALDNPSFALWTAGTGNLSPSLAYGQHSWNPTRGPNETAVNVAGAVDQLITNENFHRIGVLNGHDGWIGYVNAGPAYTLENNKDPLNLEPQTVSGQIVLDAVANGGLNTSSKLWLTKPEASSTAYRNEYFRTGDTMTGTRADAASMTLFGLKSGRYLIATGGSCPTNTAPATVCGTGQQYRFSIQPAVTPPLKLGTTFAQEQDIPNYTDLTPALKTLHNPNDKTQAFALDLQQEVLTAPAKTFLQQLQALPTLNVPNLTMSQSSTGLLNVTLGSSVYALAPVNVTKNATERAGLQFNRTGQLAVITDAQRSIVFNPSVANVAQLTKALQSFNLALTAIDANTGQLTLNSISNPTDSPLLSARPALTSDPATLGTAPGLYLAPYLPNTIANVSAGYHVYTDAAGKLLQQALYPVPYDWDALRIALEGLNFRNITLQTDGIIHVTSSDGKRYRGITDYSVLPGAVVGAAVNFAPSGDINSDGLDDLQIIYPDGRRQALLLLTN